VASEPLSNAEVAEALLLMLLW